MSIEPDYFDAGDPALCETCQRLWPIDELEQVQPDGHFVCPLWTGDGDEHVLRYTS